MFIYPEKVKKFYIGDIVISEGSQRVVRNINRHYSNIPINMRLVTTFYPSQESIYNGRLRAANHDYGKLYLIKFYFDNSPSISWHFESEEERDREFNRLLFKTGADKTFPTLPHRYTISPSDTDEGYKANASGTGEWIKFREFENFINRLFDNE
jgi:hypothetical protein